MTRQEVNRLYNLIWHRNAREDELHLHSEVWKTPFPRLVNWLVDETPYDFLHWQWPIDPQPKITAYFLDPEYQKQFGMKHYGLDLSTRTQEHPDGIGTPLRPIAQGLIVKIGFNHRDYGNYIIVKHNKFYQSLQAHLLKFDVVQGWFVNNPNVLGFSGSTGKSTGPHDHLELQKIKTLFGVSWTERINPLPFLTHTN